MNLRIIQVIIFFFAVSLSGFNLRANDTIRQNNMFIDLWGSSNWVSVNYDTRFSRSEIFGWRCGVGLSYGLFTNNHYRTGLSMPIGVNALIGHRISKFEIGIVVTPGIYFVRDSRYKLISDDQGNTVGDYYEDYGATKLRAGFTFGMDIGYRLQRTSGFCFRTGLSPCIALNSDHTYLHILSLMPYISFGYTFR